MKPCQHSYGVQNEAPIAFVELSSPGRGDRLISLFEGITTMGRLPSNDIHLEGSLISRKHARITILEGQAVLQDLGSQNGTTVNRQICDSRELKPGDLIQIGAHELHFHWERPSEPRPQAVTLAPDVQLRATTLSLHMPTHLGDRLGHLADALLNPKGDVQAAERVLNFIATECLAYAGAYQSGLRASRAIFLTTDTPPSSPQLTQAALNWAIERDIELNIERCADDPRFRELERRRDTSLLAVPVTSIGEVHGAFFLERKGPFSSSELNLVTTAAALLGMLVKLRDLQRPVNDPRRSVSSPATFHPIAPKFTDAPKLGLKYRPVVLLGLAPLRLNELLMAFHRPAEAWLAGFADRVLSRAEEGGGSVHNRLSGGWRIIFPSPQGFDHGLEELLSGAEKLLRDLLEDAYELGRAYPELTVDLSLGVEIGEAWMGALGSHEAWRYFAVSDVEERLERLMQFGPANQLLFGPRAKEGLPGRRFHALSDGFGVCHGFMMEE